MDVAQPGMLIAPALLTTETAGPLTNDGALLLGLTASDTVVVEVAAGNFVRSMTRNSPSSCLPVAGLALRCSWKGGVALVRPSIPKSLSLLMIRVFPPLRTAT